MITFVTDEESHVEFNGKEARGNEERYTLNPGERIVGVYGFLDERNVLVGLGFVVYCLKSLI